MKTSLLPLMTCTAVFAAVICNAAETNRPDCVGIRLGMPITEVRECLKTYDPKLEIQTAELQIPALGEKPVPETLFVARMPIPRTEGTNSTGERRLPRPPMVVSDPIETLQAAITLPPNDPAVWKVVRSMRFEQGREQAKTALLGALRDKYGKESLISSLGASKVSIYWVLGPGESPLQGQAIQECSMFCQRTYLGSSALDDKLARGGSKELMTKLRTMVFLSGMGNAQTMFSDPYHCNTMTYVVAELSVSDANPELVNQMRVVLIDAPLHRRATEATEAVIKKANAVGAKQEVDKARGQQTPKL
jgi:hypothetical protein